jgi:hypothetical protein
MQRQSGSCGRTCRVPAPHHALAFGVPNDSRVMDADRVERDQGFGTERF